MLAKFAYQPIPRAPFRILRCLLAAVLLARLIFEWSSLGAYLMPGGILDAAAVGLKGNAIVPNLATITGWLSHLGARPEALFNGFLILSAAGMVSMISGVLERVGSVVVWLSILVMHSTNPLAAYGVDAYAELLLFYCVVCPSCSWKQFVSDSRSEIPSAPVAAIWLRWPQIHFALGYLTAGIHKISSPNWRNGDALWRGLNQPEMSTIDVGWVANHAWIIVVSSWVVILVELLFPLGIFYKRTRGLWLVAIISLHVGIAVLLNLWVFAFVMIAANVALYSWDTGEVAQAADDERLISATETRQEMAATS